MSGFDNGTLQGGVYAQAKQLGSILRGFGPPVPQAGLVGDLYIDVQTWNLFNKRSTDAGGDVDPWGHYIFVVPVTYRTTLKWFGTVPPSNDIGIAGDYFLLWGGFANYGVQPAIYGPKTASGWPENGEGPGTVIGPVAGTVLPVGLTDEGAPIAYSTSTQLIQTGLTSEAIAPIAVSSNSGDPVGQIGLQSGPALVSVTVNPLYTAEDEHDSAVPPTAPRLPAAAPTIAISQDDVEVGIDTTSAATVCTLPDVQAWLIANTGGLDLTIFDFTGHAATNNITFTLNGTDVFTQGASPAVQTNYGELRLRPIVTGTGVNQWFVKGVG